MTALDLQAAATFCRALAHDGGGWTFQTFDDGPKKSPRLAEIIHAGPDQLETVLQKLEAYNARGAGIFLTVNRTDGKGRKSENVVALRALFVDADDVAMPEHWHATPDLLTWRSMTRWHAYWFLSPETPLQMFTQAQKKLAEFYNTDRAVHDLPRVMRVPGFIHRKGEPTEIFMEAR